MASNNGDWRTSSFRQKVIMNIDDALKFANSKGTSIEKSAVEMEQHIFERANNRDKYMSMVARIILVIRSVKHAKAATAKSVQVSSASAYPLPSSIIPSHGPAEHSPPLTSSHAQDLNSGNDSVGSDSGELESQTHRINDKEEDLRRMVRVLIEERKQETSQCQQAINRLREDLLQIVEHQKHVMIAMKQELSEIKRLLTQTLSTAGRQVSSPMTVPPNDAPARGSGKRPASKSPKDFSETLCEGPLDIAKKRKN